RGAGALVLAAHAGEDDVVFGATVSGRPADLPGVESIVGMFIHTVPVRVRVDRAATVGDWLRAVQRDRNEASEHEHASLAAVQKASDLPPGTPLFDSILVFENHAIDVEEDGGAEGLSVAEQRFVERSNFPLAVLVLPGERLELTLIHDSDRYDPRAIRRLSEEIVAALESFAEDPRCAVGDVEVLAADEREELRGLASGPPLEGTPETVLERIDAAVRRAPDAPAVLDEQGERITTYADLDARSHALAGALVSAGVRRGDRVALAIDRGRDMVVGILGTLRAGAAYVPLDPDGPAERRRAILEDVRAAALVTTRERAALAEASGPAVVRVDDLDAATASRSTDVSVSGGDAAYVLFTSGSTGRPKGVEIRHSNLARSTAARFRGYAEAVGGGEVGRYLLLSPYHFDSSVAGLFWTLCSGGALVLPPAGGERDVAALVELVERTGVTHTLCLPSVWELVLEVAAPGQLASLRAVIVAGESCAPGLVRSHAAALEDAALVNEYGPTEGTVWATAHVLDPSDPSPAVPIGRPIPGASVHLVDATLRAVPRGAPGEVLLGGGGVARGYLGRPERTAEAFVEAAPLGGAPERAYRTGDLARWREDGALEFLGRADGQVKVRGQRIEVGEIEARLAEHGGVREAVVVARMDGPRATTELAAYVVAAPELPAGDASAAALVASLRDHLAATLPAAMVPRTIDVLDALPRTGTGKVDRGALPDPTAAVELVATAAGDGPANETEQTLLPIWREVLGLERIPREASFYELGGDSLLSIRIIARAHRSGVRVDPARFADRPTLAGMAAAAEPAAGEGADEEAAATGPIPLTPIQRWFFALELPERHHWNQATWVEVPAGADADAVRSALASVVLAHDALRLRFTREGGAWRQEIEPAADFDLRVVDGSEPSQVHRAADEVQRGIDLASGRPLRALLDPERSRVLVVAHHLVVDAVSWDLLADDLRAALGRAARGAPAEVDRAPGFGAWVRRLQRHARSEAIAGEIPHWLGLRGAPAPPLDRSPSATSDPVAREESVSIQLDESTTRALLRDVPPVYGTRVLDLLLAALARAVRERTGRSSVLFDLESHGREPLGPDVDPSRVVGWLTSVHPVRLELPPGDAPGEAIKAVKEQLRAVPGGGIGFGLLRDLRGDADLEAELDRVPPRELLFNYLGQQESGGAVPTDDVGPLRSALGERAYPIEVNAEVVGGRLTARWTHGRDAYAPGAVRALARAFSDELTALVEHCSAPEAGGRTPSDFPLAGLDQSALDRLAERLGED
ncbi:MAG: amino acid adenylation domain-containing protein, partial [Planctomycetota bacterium]